MSYLIDGSMISFVAGAVRGANLRVKLSAGVLATAGVTDRAIGVQEVASLTTTEAVAVRLRNASGTVEMVASGQISEAAPVYGAADGKVSASQAKDSFMYGIAVTAAAANNDFVTVMPHASGEAGT